MRRVIKESKVGCMCNMSEESVFGKDLGIMHELIVAGRSLGMGREAWAKLAHDRLLLFDVLKLIYGVGSCKVSVKQVDFSLPPAILYIDLGDGHLVCKPILHGGSNEWGPIGETLTRLPRDNTVSHPALAAPECSRRDDPSNMNANHLDFFMMHPTMIPVEWLKDLKSGIKVFFVGTVFKKPNGNLLVRYLKLGSGGFESGYDYLGYFAFEGETTPSISIGPEARIAYMWNPSMVKA